MKLLEVSKKIFLLTIFMLPAWAGADQPVKFKRLTIKEGLSQSRVFDIVQDLAAALNELGLRPRDVIAIFQSIKQAGALNAELIII